MKQFVFSIGSYYRRLLYVKKLRNACDSVDKDNVGVRRGSRENRMCEGLQPRCSAMSGSGSNPLSPVLVNKYCIVVQLLNLHPEYKLSAGRRTSAPTTWPVRRTRTRPRLSIDITNKFISFVRKMKHCYVRTVVVYLLLLSFIQAYTK